MANNLNVTPEQFQDLIPVFTRMPESFWYTWTGLFTHYLGTGIGPEQASRDAMSAIILGLPVVRGLIGNFNVTNNVTGRAA